METLYSMKIEISFENQIKTFLTKIIKTSECRWNYKCGLNQD
jgi:hypothetical protein